MAEKNIGDEKERKLKLGLVAASGFSTSLCYRIQERLSETLSQEIHNDSSWEVEVEVDRLTGAVDNVQEILIQASNRKAVNDWDYVISLTDLPLFSNKLIVLADVDVTERIAQVSLPAFGMASTPKKVEKTMNQIVKELYFRSWDQLEEYQLNKKGPGFKLQNRKSRLIQKIPRIFKFSEIEREENEKKDGGTSIRFFVHPKVKGRVKVILGMTVANRPWSIMPSFKKVVGLAFATGSYMLIFNTLWQLSSIYEILRFIALMMLAMTGMVAWITLAHNLWEKKSDFNSNRLRWLYNMTTIITLGIAVIIFYIAMFILFLFAVAIFVPADLFGEVIGHTVGVKEYVKLAWLVSSVATVAGAIGGGLENEEEVRKSTYGYRQYLRSKAMKE